MQNKLDLAERFSSAGIVINSNKIKSLVENMATPSSFTVAGKSVEIVESF